MFARFVLGLATVVSAFMMSTMPAYAAEPINGRWVTEERDAVVDIKRCGNTTCGTISRFLVTPPDGADQRDINNDDPEKQKRKLLGLAVLTDFHPEVHWLLLCSRSHERPLLNSVS